MGVYTNVYQHGSNLYVRYIKEGRRYARKVDFRPTLWTSSGKGESEWKNLEGNTVYPFQPGSIQDVRQFIDQYKDVHGFNVYQPPSYSYQYIAENYPGELRFNPQDIQIFSIDIETTVENGFPDPAIADEQIILLTVKDTRHAKVITWGTTQFGEFKNTFDYVEYRSFDTEQALLMDFIRWWQQNYPDAATGWNSSLFDITYLYNRMCRVIGKELADRLSPWGKTRQSEVDISGRTVIKTYLAGIALLDYLDLYKKFTYVTRESYKLDYIAQVELGEKKVENPGSSFQDFYTNYWQTFVVYNIRDVELVDRLDAKLKLIDLVLTMSYAAKINYEDVFSPVRTWDAIIYNYLNEQKVVIPIQRGVDKAHQYEGAHVKDPLVGKHRWVVSFDLNSLYPMLICQYNMSPETITDIRLDVSVDKLLTKVSDLSPAKDNNFAVAANGCCFQIDKKGLLPTLMQLYYDKRVIYKNEMLAAKQQYEVVQEELGKRGAINV